MSTTTTTTYTVFPIEPPVSPSQLTAYKTLRLTSLQVEPHAFVSTYAHEVTFPEDAWRQRLDSPFKRTLVASVSDASAHERRDVDRSVDVGETEEWIGTATILGPSEMPPYFVAPVKEAGLGANWEIYGLYAVWVHPTHRGKGVGIRLIKECLEWARTNVDTKFSSSNNGGEFEKVAILLVYDNNTAARALYSSTGFTDLEEISEKVPGEMWMSCRV